MYGKDSGTGERGSTLRAVVIPALASAIISVFLMRSGFLSIFFLAPLGYSAAAYSPASAWFALVSAVIINGMLSLGQYSGGGWALGIDVLYYTVMALGFTWIMSGRQAETAFPGTGIRGTLLRVRTLYRFIIASVAGAGTFLGIASMNRNSEGFAGLARSQAEWLSSIYISASGADAARRSFLEQSLTPEKVMNIITMVVLRGGALASAVFMLYINRQAALGLARIFRRRRSAQELSGFHVPVNTIWVLSVSLAAILLSRMAGFRIPEIAAWNVLVLCVILFLAQGGGIVFYTLTKRPMPPLARMISRILVVVLIFSPGINTAALGMLILLGIAENWLPLRAAKQDGSASTPGL